MKDDQTGDPAQIARIIRAIAEIGRTAEARSAADTLVPLDRVEIAALRAVGDGGAIRMKDLAHEVGLAPNSATNLVDRMVAKDLVQRDRNAADRRIVMLTLTRRGRKIWTRISEEHLKLFERMLADFAPEERESLLRMMQRLALDPEAAQGEAPPAKARRER
jgi:DNA-binding MarR family transcriptional regulator